jgi:hypothetical protein
MRVFSIFEPHPNGHSSSQIDAEENPEQQFTLHSVSSDPILGTAFGLPIEAPARAVKVLITSADMLEEDEE